MLKRRSSSGFDARGRAVVEYSPPEDVLVWGWFLASDEVAANGHELRVECDATVYLPLALAVKVGDRIELPGEGWFDVDRIVDYDRNPWWRPGLVDMKLRRVSG